MGVYDYQEQLLTTGQFDIDLLVLKDLLRGAYRDADKAPLYQLYLQQAIDGLRKSQTAELLLQHCAKAGICLRVDSLLEANQSSYDVSDNVLHVSMQQTMCNLDMHQARLGQMMVALATGLREAWHCCRGHGFHPELSVRDFLHLCRSADADAVAFVTLICWELHEKKLTSAWKQWLSGDNADVALVFEDQQLRSGGKDADGLKKALQASYRQWFEEDTREAAADHKALEKLDRLLIKCRTENKDTSWIGQADLTPQTWARLGEIPGQHNYLSHAERLLHHGYHDQPRDAFNRVHFQHLVKDLVDE